MTERHSVLLRASNRRAAKQHRRKVNIIIVSELHLADAALKIERGANAELQRADIHGVRYPNKRYVDSARFPRRVDALGDYLENRDTQNPPPQKRRLIFWDPHRDDVVLSFTIFDARRYGT